MKWDHIWAIARKDIREIRQNRAVWLPMLVVPVIFVLIMPGALLIAAHLPAAEALFNDPDMATFMNNMPPSMLQPLQDLGYAAGGVVLFLGYFFAPFFLIMPIMFASTISADLFAGELERKTMEGLLYTSVSDTELFLGKVTAAAVPAIAYTWVSFVFYALVLNIGAYDLIGRIWFPLPTWWPLIFWITPALAAFGIAVTVLISAKVKTFMGAYQSGSMTVLVVIALMLGQVSGVLYLSVGVGLLVGLVFWIIAAVMMYIGVSKFNRKTILLTSQ